MGDPNNTAISGGKVSSTRCDSATYLQGYPYACIFDETSAVLTYRRSSPSYSQAASHYYQALNSPSSTKPTVVGKVIPGKYRTNRFLSRNYYDPAKIDSNSYQARKVCIAVAAAAGSQDYTNGGTLECDEFPFASTQQGASEPGQNFSAKAILKNHNREAGKI
jgi:hypothetical protein